MKTIADLKEEIKTPEGKEKLLNFLSEEIKDAQIKTPMLYQGHFVLEEPDKWDDTHGGGPKVFVSSYASDHGAELAWIMCSDWWEEAMDSYPGWSLLDTCIPVSAPLLRVEDVNLEED